MFNARMLCGAESRATLSKLGREDMKLRRMGSLAITQCFMINECVLTCCAEKYHCSIMLCGLSMQLIFCPSRLYHLYKILRDFSVFFYTCFYYGKLLKKSSQVIQCCLEIGSMKILCNCVFGPLAKCEWISKLEICHSNDLKTHVL